MHSTFTRPLTFQKFPMPSVAATCPPKMAAPARGRERGGADEQPRGEEGVEAASLATEVVTLVSVPLILMMRLPGATKPIECNYTQRMELNPKEWN